MRKAEERNVLGISIGFDVGLVGHEDAIFDGDKAKRGGLTRICRISKQLGWSTI